ncbi:flagellar biosynthetic protein FliO [uncultured Sphingomonas sp.]|uniref:flagellar biosynthetic protein FliO n=1 Tax=uncultured Sphingomonas sp. TaxID=158754 RepID=UPI0035C944CC
MGVGTVVSSIVALVLSLALVLGLAWAAIFALRKWQDRSLGAHEAGAANDRTLRFIRALPLGQRERVVLIEVGAETMLLGIGAGGVTLLSRWDASGAAVDIALPVARAPTVPPPGQSGGPSW